MYTISWNRETSSTQRVLEYRTHFQRSKYHLKLNTTSIYPPHLLVNSNDPAKENTPPPNPFSNETNPYANSTQYLTQQTPFHPVSNQICQFSTNYLTIVWPYPPRTKQISLHQRRTFDRNPFHININWIL